MSIAPSSSIWTGPTGPSLGAHAQCAAGFDADSLWAWSSWIGFTVRLETDIKSMFRNSNQVPLPAPAASVDLTDLISYFEFQHTSDCVGCAFEGAHHIATRGQGKRTSPFSWYRGARLRERQRKGAPITDTGSIPLDAANAAITVGVYPRDARDDDPSTVNQNETWDEAAASRIFDPENFVQVPDGDVEAMKSHLTARHGLVFCMPKVDASYENFASNNPIARLSWGYVAANVTMCIAVLGGPVFQ